MTSKATARPSSQKAPNPARPSSTRESQEEKSELAAGAPERIAAAYSLHNTRDPHGLGALKSPWARSRHVRTPTVTRCSSRCQGPPVAHARSPPAPRPGPPRGTRENKDQLRCRKTTCPRALAPVDIVPTGPGVRFPHKVTSPPIQQWCSPFVRSIAVSRARCAIKAPDRFRPQQSQIPQERRNAKEPPRRPGSVRRAPPREQKGSKKAQTKRRVKRR